MSFIAPSVTDQTPTIAKLLTVPAVSSLTYSTQSIQVPLSVLNRVVVFMPPGTNYAVGVGVGINGKKFIPTEDVSDYIYGPGFAHDYPAGWQVQDAVEIFFRQENLYNHRIYVALYCDRRPTQKTSGNNLVLPS